MATTNLPPLYRNILDILPSDFARDVFLWAVEQPGEDRMCYRAERFANEAHQLVTILSPLLAAAAKGQRLDSAPEGLLPFILTRHANLRIGANARPAYAGAGQ